MLRAAVVAAVAVALASSPVFALEPVNDTGQVQCYDGAGAAIACTTALGTQEDGWFGRDVAAANGALVKAGAGIAGFDFTKISPSGAALPASAPEGTGPTDWLCTRDNHTGKLWYRPSLSGSWSAVATAAAALNAGAGQCGRSDWRVARTSELIGIVNYAIGGFPNVDTTYFPSSSISSGGPITWAAESYPTDASLGYVVVYNGGAASLESKTNNHRALAVSGAAPTAPNLVPQGDGTALDARTGLVFTQCALGQSTSGATCSGTALTFNWQNALVEVAARNGASYLGRNDWRLPNAKELLSIAIVSTDFVSSVRAWSSTTFPSFQTSGMVVDLNFGFTYDLGKANTATVRLVRAGDAQAGFFVDPGAVFRNGFE